MAIFLDKSDTVLRQIFGHFWCCIFRVCLQLCENFYLQRWFQMQQLFLQVCRNNTKICSRVKRWTFALITITWATLTFSEIEGCCAKYFCEGALRCPDHFLIFRGYSHHSTADRLKRIFFKCCGRDTPYLSTKWAWVLSNGMNTSETMFETKRKKVPNVV